MSAGLRPEREGSEGPEAQGWEAQQEAVGVATAGPWVAVPTAPAVSLHEGSDLGASWRAGPGGITMAIHAQLRQPVGTSMGTGRLRSPAQPSTPPPLTLGSPGRTSVPKTFQRRRAAAQKSSASRAQTRKLSKGCIPTESRSAWGSPLFDPLFATLSLGRASQ